MNHGKHVIPEKVSMSANILPKYLEGKIKSSTSMVFYINLPVVSVWSNMSDTIGYLHWSLQT
jgi:hypothetical protein